MAKASPTVRPWREKHNEHCRQEASSSTSRRHGDRDRIAWRCGLSLRRFGLLRVYCTNVLIGAGNTCTHGTYHGRIYGVEGHSTGSAYSGVWLNNSNGDRVSDAAYCEQPGCTAAIFWDTSQPRSGFPALHNHSGFTSRFTGDFFFF